MDGILAAFFSGSAASALISGIFALVQARLRRGKQHTDTEQALVDGSSPRMWGLLFSRPQSV